MPGEDDNSRIATRVELKVQVDMRNENTFFTGFSENISEGGLFVATEAPYEIGESLEFELKIMGTEILAGEFKAIVRWVRPANTAGGLPAGMGLQFVDLPPEATAGIQRFIDSRMKDTLFFDLD